MKTMFNILLTGLVGCAMCAATTSCSDNEVTGDPSRDWAGTTGQGILLPPHLGCIHRRRCQLPVCRRVVTRRYQRLPTGRSARYRLLLL